MKCLGAPHQDNGGTEVDFQKANKSMLASFYANLEEPKGGFADIVAHNVDARLRRFRNATRGVVGYSSPGWSPTEALESKLTKLEKDLTARLCPWKKKPDTSWVQWSKCVNIWCEEKMSSKKSWTALARARQLGWYRHVQRHPDCWVYRLLEHDTPKQLQSARRFNFGTLPIWARNPLSGRTCTRSIRERVVPRWSESFAKLHVEQAEEQPLGTRAPAITKGLSQEVVKAFREQIGHTYFVNPLLTTES